MMKKQIVFPLILGLLSTPTFAGSYQHGFRDKAKVIDVEPIIEIVEVPVEREACWEEDVETTTRSNTGKVVGGIIGGVLGHQVGHGNRRKVATVAGSVIGAAIGSKADDRSAETTYETRNHCRVRTEYEQEERLQAYLVTYRYRGQIYTTEMDREPGRFIPVNVNVAPVD